MGDERTIGKEAGDGRGPIPANGFAIATRIGQRDIGAPLLVAAARSNHGGPGQVDRHGRVFIESVQACPQFDAN